jgi:hypothetical protein
VSAGTSPALISDLGQIAQHSRVGPTGQLRLASTLGHDVGVADVSAERSASRRRGRGGWRPGGPAGCGCASFIVVLTVGIALSLFNADIGIGLSVRVPFTESNLTVAGSVGAKQKSTETLPNYVEGRLGGNQNFINQSATLTIGPAEGTALLVLGHQDGAPVVDLHLAAR